MKTNTKAATITLLFILGMAIALFAYQVKEFIVNDVMVQWNMFTMWFALITIGFCGVDKKKKAEKAELNK